MAKRQTKPKAKRQVGGSLDPEEVRKKAVARLHKMTPADLFAVAVRAGIYTKDGELTAPYRDDAGPSACRPTD